MMQVAPWYGSTVALSRIAEEWVASCNKGWMGLEVDLVCHLNDLRRLIDGDRSDLLVLIEDDVPIGYMGLTLFTSPLGDQQIANEHYWFVQARRRGIGSLRLLKAARDWARDKQASHLILTASNLASDLHDRVCRMYAARGMQKFETSFITRV